MFRAISYALAQVRNSREEHTGAGAGAAGAAPALTSLHSTWRAITAPRAPLTAMDVPLSINVHRALHYKLVPQDHPSHNC